ncbi:hypothetical protein T492DRAFT_847492 [Pavlovales sp. CCMP2436]|nr:hypothetical protein T492DRAFT_847492 [Pavlovales sp. CCMP2436]
MAWSCESCQTTCAEADYRSILTGRTLGGDPHCTVARPQAALGCAARTWDPRCTVARPKAALDCAPRKPPGNTMGRYSALAALAALAGVEAAGRKRGGTGSQTDVHSFDPERWLFDLRTVLFRTYGADCYMVSIGDRVERFPNTDWMKCERLALNPAEAVGGELVGQLIGSELSPLGGTQRFARADPACPGGIAEAVVDADRTYAGLISKVEAGRPLELNAFAAADGCTFALRLRGWLIDIKRGGTEHLPPPHVRDLPSLDGTVSAADIKVV